MCVQVGSNGIKRAIGRVSRNEDGKVTKRIYPTATKVKHPLKVHVWGGISRRGPTRLLVFNNIMDAEFYTTQILEQTLLPSINELYPPPDSHRFWQDNDPKHTSRRAQTFMEDNSIQWFKTPAESPDLNPIENVWATLKFYVARDVPTSQNELVQSIVKFWNSHLTVEQCNRYIDHVFRVIPKVIEAKGSFSGC